MKSSPTPPIAIGPLTLCGVEWATPDALIASAPHRERGQTYQAFFKSLKKWAEPLLKECEKLCGHAVGRIDISHPAKPYLAAIYSHIDQWRPVKFADDDSAHEYTENEIGLFKNGKIDVPTALDLIWYAAVEKRLPPPPVIYWMIESINALNDGTTLDECFGVVEKRGSKKTVMRAAWKAGVDHMYACEMALLIDNGLTVEAAAALVESQYDMFERYGMMSIVNSKVIEADSIAKYWKTDWKKRFENELKAFYFENPRYIAMRDAGEIKFCCTDTVEDYWRAIKTENHKRIEVGYFHGQNLCFPSHNLTIAKNQGLKIAIK